MMVNNIILNGNQTFMGKNIPVVEGGFGEGAKCISDRTVAEIHGITVSDVRKAVGRNIKRFKNGVDYIDLKAAVQNNDGSKSPSRGDDLLTSMGYSKQQIIQAEHIYLLSERGYAKLIKIMDTDFAWEIHDKLMDDYFHIRNAVKDVSEKLDSVNTAIHIITPLLEREGCSNKIVLLTAKLLYRKAGIELPVEINAGKKYYDTVQIAKACGMYSRTGKPANMAVGAIIRKLDIDESMYIDTWEGKGNWQGTVRKYSEEVVDLIRNWLKDNAFPEIIVAKQKNGDINRHVVYKDEVVAIY